LTIWVLEMSKNNLDIANVLAHSSDIEIEKKILDRGISNIAVKWIYNNLLISVAFARILLITYLYIVEEIIDRERSFIIDHVEDLILSENCKLKSIVASMIQVLLNLNYVG